MHVTPTANRIPFQPDVTIVPRSFVDAVALPRLDAFGGFGSTNVASVAAALVRAADRDGDGDVDVPEASSVSVRDNYTTPHPHWGGHVLSTFYIDAVVDYDALVPIVRADVSGDGATTSAELQAWVERATGLTADRTIDSWSPEYRLLSDALSGATPLRSLAHGEIEYRTPW